MTAVGYELRATADCCGYRGSLAAIALHSCQVVEQGGRCEDYPCCGHTDGDGCQTLPEHTAGYWTDGPGRAHLMCDHEAGVCDAYDDDEPEDDDEDDEDDEDDREYEPEDSEFLSQPPTAPVSRRWP